MTAAAKAALGLRKNARISETDEDRMYGIWNRQDEVWVTDATNRILESPSRRVMMAQALGGSIHWTVAEISEEGMPLDVISGQPLFKHLSQDEQANQTGSSTPE